MRGTVYKVSFTLLAVLALLLVVGLVWGGMMPTVQAESQPAPLAQKPDNAGCLGCHSAPDQVYTFPNGDTISLSVNQEVYDHAVHMNLACQVCHTNMSGYPHPKNPAQSAREYTLQYKDSCAQCHPSQTNQVMDNAHARLAQEGNPNTPVCADCHDPHEQLPIAKDANGDPAPSEHANIANICAACHSTIVDEYRESVHGMGVFVDNNPDVPACDQCHGIHNLTQASTIQFRLNSPQMCAECHTDETIMSKYGISTAVLDTYVSDFHGTTITLFEKTSPEQATNKPVCYDCHGVHNILAVDDPQKGLQVKENMLVACQSCHPDASENFSDAWMSHYIPDPQKTPLVYYVNLFYLIFVPSVLGGMAIFVVADIYGKFRNRGINSAHQTGSKEE
jgi:hypothetical protein